MNMRKIYGLVRGRSRASFSWVKTTRTIRGLATLTRPWNCIALSVLFVAVRRGVATEIDRDTLLVATAWGFAAAAGYVWNDITDIEIDQDVHPRRALPSGVVNSELARMWAAALAIGALGLVLQSGAAASVWVSIAILGATLYSSVIRPWTSLGANVLCAVLVAMVPLSAMNGTDWLGISVAGFVFCVTLGRELVKDVLESDGDKLRRPGPALGQGDSTTAILARWILVVSMLVIGLLVMGALHSDLAIVGCLAAVVIAVLALIPIGANRVISPAQSRLLKAAAFCLSLSILW